MDNMKKVLFTATVDSHIINFHLPFLKLFKEKGYEVHVATNGNEKIPYCDVKHVISFERSPYKINNLKAIKQLKKVCDENKFDIIHCHTPMGSAVTRLAAKNARKNYHTRVIYTAHGFHFYKGAPLLNWLLFYPVEKFLAKYTDTLITINNEDYELAKRKFSKRCKDIQYVPGVGVNCSRFDSKNISDETTKKLRDDLKINNNDFVLTCVARLDKNKNQGFLIDVMAELVKQNKRNIKLLLVGPDECNGIYYDKVKQFKLENNVIFIGQRSDIPEILSISDVVVSASHREGLPVNVIEAMAASIPVVALYCRGMTDLIIDGETGYVVNDFSTFLNAILKLYGNKTLKYEFGFNAYARSSSYDLSKICDVMFNIYNLGGDN